MQQPQVSIYAVARVLRYRTFAWVFATQLIDDTSDSIYLLVLPFLVLESGGSGLAIGITGASAVLPHVIIRPFAGVLADRVNRSVVMMGANLLRAVVLCSILVVWWLIDLATWHLATAAFLLTTADVDAHTARNALIPTLVPQEELVAANSLSVAGWHAVSIGGKAAAGFLLFLIGSAGAISVSISFYLMALLLLVPLRTPLLRLFPGLVLRGAGGTYSPTSGVTCGKLVCLY
jgi:Transmembrane secretion effector